MKLHDWGRQENLPRGSAHPLLQQMQASRQNCPLQLQRAPETALLKTEAIKKRNRSSTLASWEEQGMDVDRTGVSALQGTAKAGQRSYSTSRLKVTYSKRVIQLSSAQESEISIQSYQQNTNLYSSV